MKTMRNKIKRLLIRLANWIGDKTYYDFGDEIVGLRQFEDSLYVGTKGSVFRSKDGKKWKKVGKFR